jgi:hypothetical protein
MARVECSVAINAPVDVIYDVSQDYSVRYEWDPFPERIELMRGATAIAKGVNVSVKAKGGLYMEVEFVQIKPPTTAAIKMVKGPFFLRSFAGAWIFREEDKSLTSARFVYAIEMKFWTLPYFSERLAVWYFGRAIKARLNGLKVYCENRVKFKHKL